MNCELARELLPLEIHGDLNAEERGALTNHLEDCELCRNERETLRSVQQMLNAATVPPIAVDISRIRQDAVAMQHRSLRRWKRAAFAVGSLAAGLLLVLSIRPEIEIGNGQLVLRWNEQQQELKREEPKPSIVLVPQPIRDNELEERIHILSDLMRGLREEMETSDRVRKDQLEALVARLDAVRLQSLQRYDETRRDVRALYTAQFSKNDKGDRR